MSMKEALAPHLPYLRRYARALSGSQQRGDDHVRATLGSLIGGKQTLTEGVSPRVGLYRAFQDPGPKTVRARLIRAGLAPPKACSRRCRDRSAPRCC